MERFTALGPLPDLPLPAIRQEYRVRRLSGEKPDRDEFARRFRQLPELPLELDRIDGELDAVSTRPLLRDPTFPDGATAVRCAYCQHPIDLSFLQSDAGDIQCPSCDGQFYLADVCHASLRARRISHFELIEPLGQGSFGTVWRARDTRLHRDVAVKIPRVQQLDPR